MLMQLAKMDMPLLDEWDLLLRDSARRDLPEIFDNRHGYCSTNVTSQLSVVSWH